MQDTTFRMCSVLAWSGLKMLVQLWLISHLIERRGGFEVENDIVKYFIPSPFPKFFFNIWNDNQNIKIQQSVTKKIKQRLKMLQ